MKDILLSGVRHDNKITAEYIVKFLRQEKSKIAFIEPEYQTIDKLGIGLIYVLNDSIEAIEAVLKNDEKKLQEDKHVLLAKDLVFCANGDCAHCSRVDDSIIGLDCEEMLLKDAAQALTRNQQEREKTREREV